MVSNKELDIIGLSHRADKYCCKCSPHYLLGPLTKIQLSFMFPVYNHQVFSITLIPSWLCVVPLEFSTSVLLKFDFWVLPEEMLWYNMAFIYISSVSIWLEGSSLSALSVKCHILMNFPIESLSKNKMYKKNNVMNISVPTYTWMSILIHISCTCAYPQYPLKNTHHPRGKDSRYVLLTYINSTGGGVSVGSDRVTEACYNISGRGTKWPAAAPACP